MNRNRTTLLCGLAALAFAGLAGRPLPARVQDGSHTEYGPLAIRGYELKEVRFDPPFRVIRPDGTVDLKSFGWQVVVKGDAFPVRALDPVLWVDGVKLVRYTRCGVEGADALAYSFFDPKLLRSEHVLQLIYGNDERTRTKLLERFDPERLVRLPDEQRRELGIPELESLTLTAATAKGRVEGHGRLADGAGEVRIAARLADGSFEVVPGAVALGADGKFTAEIGAWPATTTHAAALLVPAGVKLGAGALRELPAQVELLDVKPLGTGAAH